MKRLFRIIPVSGVLLCAILLTSCLHKDETAPKPMGYFRIDLPEHQYVKMDTALFPFTFEKSTHSVVKVTKRNADGFWLDVNYPEANATFKFTYMRLDNADSLRNLLIQEQRMVKFHYQKADDVEYSEIRDPEAHLWGQIFDIEGKEVATPLQFWMTDSAHHFLRATLYFNFTPNNDSLQPVIQYLREDAMRMVETFNWR